MSYSLVDPSSASGRTAPACPDNPSELGPKDPAQAEREAQLRSEEALRQSEDRFRSAMENSPIGMALAAISGRWLEVNPAFCKIVGYTREEMLALDFQTLTHPDDRQAGAELVKRTLEGPATKYQREKRYVHKDGHPVWIQLNFSLIKNPDGTPRHFVSQVQDITGRRQAELSLRDFQSRLILAMDMARLGHWEYDVASDRFHFDQNYYKLLRTTSELQGGALMSSADYVSKFLPPEEAELVLNEIRKAVETPDPGYTRKLEHRFIRADGSMGTLSVRFAVTKDSEGRTVSVFGLDQDISEQREAEQQRNNLEDQLRQSQKMDALGKLAGGIAHDFNNILTGIIGNLQLAELDIPAGHPASPALEEAGKASKRARDLVARILSFSRHERNDRHAAPLGPIISEAVQLLRASLPSTIDIRTRIGLDCPPVLFSEAQMHQVVMNLGTNAAHAMREQGGVLFVELRHSEPTRELMVRNPQITPRHTVCLTIRDSGRGMSQEVLKRIFEPFFTTKAVGEGTGLGLAVVHNIIQNHDGAIVVGSTPGVGTAFEIYFQAAAACDSGEGGTAPGFAPDTLEAFGNGRNVMLVDDEQSVRQLGVSLLTRMGFRVEAFSHPVAALGAFLSNPGQYAVVISDLTMPDMTGLELARRITDAQPGIPFIVASGNFHLSEQDEDLVLNHLHVIEKPFEVSQFVTQLRAALGGFV
jgi:PAS domain S-box-containing protein